jgi:hypothetical protein
MKIDLDKSDYRNEWDFIIGILKWLGFVLFFCRAEHSLL